jgi:CheY-like chemotaxis protein
MDPDSLRIILVEDDPFNQETIQAVLEGAGHTVRATDRGSEALRWLEEEPCDLLMMDLRMPEMDGPSLYRMAKERWLLSAPRPLFVSGYADLGPYGADPDMHEVPILFKPFTLSELFSAVKRALEQVPSCDA